MISCSCGGEVRFLLLVFCLILGATCHNFIEVPVNTTCTLEQTVILRCRPPGNTILVHWTVNGESYRNFLPTSAFSASNFLYTLQFTCTSEWHYRTVQCVARILSGEDEESPPALIKVEGLPDRIESVNYTSSSSTITLSWDPPAPELTYLVQVNNYTSEGEHASSESVLVMEPMFVLPRNGTEDGFVFEFTVTAVGQNGNGPPSLLVRTNFSTLQPDPETSTSALLTSLATMTSHTPTSPVLVVSASTTISGVISETEGPRLAPTGLPVSVIAMIAAGVPLTVVICVMCALVIVAIVTLTFKKRAVPAVTMEMSKCDAYESGKCANGGGVSLEKRKEFASYECITNPEEHVYAHVH